MCLTLLGAVNLEGWRLIARHRASSSTCGGSVATFFLTSFTLVAAVLGLFVCLMCLLTYPFHFPSVPRGKFSAPSTGGKFLKPASQPSPPAPWPPGQWLIHRWQNDQLPVFSPPPPGEKHTFPDVKGLVVRSLRCYCC